MPSTMPTHMAHTIPGILRRFIAVPLKLNVLNHKSSFLPFLNPPEISLNGLSSSGSETVRWTVMTAQVHP